MEQTTSERRVHYIPPTRQITARSQRRRSGRQRVAAYCRVSTNSEEQLNSYAAQKAYYTQHILENPDWEMAGIFADEGLSGTSMKKRAAFNRMIAACKRGRIDMILTKSLSRFARNTVDCLRIVRMLKANGIGVIFEKENINTLTESSEFLITLFSGFAQAESESLRGNILLGLRQSMKEGKVTFQYKKMLGYRRGADGKPEIVPEEAATVRRIYTRYLEGASLGDIKKELEADGIPTAEAVQGWSYQVIRNILTNEKYYGDALLQKTYTTDCISKKVVKNLGDLPMYHVERNHPGIVSKDMFQRVQADGPPYQQAEGDAEVRQNRAGQILRQIRSVRTAGLRRVRYAIQAVYLGQERKEADRLAVYLAAGVRDKILPRVPHVGRGQAPQSHCGRTERVWRHPGGSAGGCAGIGQHGPVSRRGRQREPAGVEAATGDPDHRTDRPAGQGAGEHGRYRTERAAPCAVE